MSVIVKSSKIGMYLLIGIVAVFVFVGVMAYVKRDALAVQLIEDAASRALGGQVSIGGFSFDEVGHKITLDDVALTSGDGAPLVSIDTIAMDYTAMSYKVMDFNHVMLEGVVVHCHDALTAYHKTLSVARDAQTDKAAASIMVALLKADTVRVALPDGTQYLTPDSFMVMNTGQPDGVSYRVALRLMTLLLLQHVDQPADL